MNYTQNDEQKIIGMHVADIECGSVLDIGAGDGKTFSNSLALIERGWNAVLVEPSPFAFAKIAQLHNGNERVRLLNAAIGTETVITKFYECENTLISTTMESKAKFNREQGLNVIEYWVPQVTISTVVTQLGTGCHVLSIDIEGRSVDVLFTIPGAWVPRVIVVEHDSRPVEISGWAREHGYRVCGLNAENVLLVHE